jgi:hypothetical protein
MEPNFDLDINNYTTTDLLNFFKLDNTFSLDDLIKKEIEVISEITKVKSNYTSKYKTDLINFIKFAKENLISLKHEIENTTEVNKNIKKQVSSFINVGKDDTVGRIINPLSTHPALERNINPPDDINGYRYNTTTSVYVFNTLARNDFILTKSSDCIFDLPMVWNNVIQITLSSVNIQNVMFAFNSDAGTNQIFIKEDSTGISGIVTIPSGNYVPYSFGRLQNILPVTQASFVDVLQTSINTQLGTNNRFTVAFDPSNYSVTISNSTNTFSINTIIKESSDVCNDYSKFHNNNFEIPNITNKANITTSGYVQTMGYLMGYRKLYYSGSKSYTTESIFNNTYSDYLYFVLEDYTGSQTSSNTYGILGNSILSQNILGVIPINSSLFATTFDNNANFIYKKREYFGPVNIARISVKILNQKGNIVNLRETEYSFSLQVKTIYNLTKKSVPGIRGFSAI